MFAYDIKQIPFLLHANGESVCNYSLPARRKLRLVAIHLVHIVALIIRNLLIHFDDVKHTLDRFSCKGAPINVL